jgi:hypothetical protein
LLIATEDGGRVGVDVGGWGKKGVGWGSEHDKMLIILNNGHTLAKTRKITHQKFP